MDYIDLSKEFLQAFYQFHKKKTHKKINNAMHGEAFVLQYIAQFDNTAVPGDIENAMNVSSARITTLLNGLENKGLISRQIDSIDRRRILIKLTPAGEEQAAENMRQLLDLTSEILEYLGEEDANNFVRIICRLAERWSCEAG